MFLFEDKGVKKQIVGYWTTKTYKDVRTNGVNWGPAADIAGTPDNFSYNGIATFWFWDGQEFHKTPPKNSRFTTVLNNGGVNVDSEDVQLSSSQEGTRLRFCRDPKEFDLDVASITPNPPPVGYKRTMLSKKLGMGFDALKIYHANWTGTLSIKGSKRKADGSVYMQHICLNTPALPWLWGVFHKDDGSYFTYFTSFLGPHMLRRKAECKPEWDNRFKFLNKNLNYTPAGEKTKRFRQVRYNVFRQENGLPGFETFGELGKEKLRVKMRTLAKCTYTFERRKLWQNRFFYNEFPAEVMELEYTDGKGNVHRENGGAWNGNCEYSWGMLLN